MTHLWVKLFIGVSVFSLLFFLYKNYLYRVLTEPKPGIVIILNGPSAAGKSSLQKNIQRLAPIPYLSIGIDNLFNDPFPDEHGKLQAKTIHDFHEDLRFVTIEDNTVFLHLGKEGRKIVDGMNQAIVAYAKTGNNVVVDYIMYDPKWMEELLYSLRGYPVYLIGINLPLEVIEQREQARSTSPIGHARSHYDNVHYGNKYDLMLDDPLATPSQGAEKILEFIQNNPR